MTDEQQLLAIALEDEQPHGSVQRLGARQQQVLDALRLGPMPAWEIGALVHAAQEKHAFLEHCEWCERDGHQLARSLRRRKLVRLTRRTGLYQLAGGPTPGSDPGASESASRSAPASPASYDPQTSDWPEGF